MKRNYLYLIWFAALLPVMLLRDYTPDNELRYLSIVDEALQSGHLFTFTNQGIPYADKPPLYFWLMMAGKLLLGGHRIWFLSLLSFLPAVVIVRTMSVWVRREEGVDLNLASLMMMTTGLFTGLALVVRMDMLMCMFIVLALHTFFKIYRGRGRKRDSLLFPLYVFLALFSKGPVGILVPLVSTLIFLLYRRRLHTWSDYWGWKSLLVLLLGCVIWFAGVYLEAGSGYLHNLLVHQTVDRGINAFHHKEPFYYYGITVWYSLAPWMFLAVGLIIAGAVRRNIQREVEQFFLTVILSSLLILSLISSKLAVYLLPAFPFFIYLTALLLRKFGEENGWLRLSLAIPALIFAPALPVLLLFLSRREDAFYAGFPLVQLAAAIISLCGVAVLYLLVKKQLYRSIRVMATGVLLTLFVAGLSMPEMNRYLGWRELCETAVGLAAEKQTSNYYVYGIRRAENMDVFLKKDVIFADREEILQERLDGGVLMLSDKTVRKEREIRDFLAGKERHRVGNNWIVKL